MLNISKQSVHQSRKRQHAFDMELRDLVCQVDIIRSEHPGCGLEKLYYMLQPKTMGRDKFCEIFMALGYRVRKIKNYTKTTKSSRRKYPNLISGMQIMRPFQVIQSDITYIYIAGVFKYIVFITDVYTREILGYNVSDNLRATSNMKALKMALPKIPKDNYDTLIHHSDGGIQYQCLDYTKILTDNNISISMGKIAQDNAFAERVNGIIKNEYLKSWDITDFNSLKAKIKKAVNHYNSKRLHLAFKNKYSPLQFKKNILTLNPQERPKVIIYAEGNCKVKEASRNLNFDLRKEPQAHNCPIVIREMK